MMKLTASCKHLFKFNPFKKMLRHLFKFRLRKPLFLSRLLRRRSRNRIPADKHHRIRRWSIFRSLRKAADEEEEEATELKSFSDTNNIQMAPFPSPLTPAYVRMIAEANKESAGSIPDEVGDASRRFEKLLAEMFVEEEGKMMTRDLMDNIDDLIYCWENLKCPVFLDLVCRFYGDLCKDLFSDNNSPLHSDIIPSS